jgi:hypothetical protein
MAEQVQPVSKPATQGSIGGDDWPAQAADLIVSTVDTVRDKTTGPILKAARGVVYGSFAALVGIAVAVWACIWWVRFWTNIFGEVWITYFFTGGLLLIAALFLWRKGISNPEPI